MQSEKTSEDKTDLKDVNNDTIEITEKIKQIKMIIDKLPEDVKNLFLNKINELISIYKVDREKEENNLKSAFSMSNTIPSLTLNSNVDAKMKLMLGLDSILYKLSSSEVYLNLITELNSYQELAKAIPNEYDGENKDISGMIKNISYIANKMDDNNKNDILNKLNQILSEPRNKYERLINSSINTKIELTTDSSITPKQELMLNLSTYLDEVKELYEVSKTYLEMLEGLKSDDATNKINISSISSTIETTKYALSMLDKTEELKELEKEINKTNKEYEEAIISRLKSKTISKEDYKELEKEYRIKLNPLLERLNSLAKKDAHFKDLKQKLLSSQQIMNEEKSVEDKFKSVIETFTVEMHNRIINSNLNLYDKQELLNKISLFIDSKLKSLDTLKYANKNDIERVFNKDFAGLLMNIDNYIASVGKYKNKKEENSIIEKLLEENIKGL